MVRWQHPLGNEAAGVHAASGRADPSAGLPQAADHKAAFISVAAPGRDEVLLDVSFMLAKSERQDCGTEFEGSWAGHRPIADIPGLARAARSRPVESAARPQKM
jgi:hypothetical protein